MNKKKWRNPEMPLSHLGLKLAEETGEVVTEILNAAENNWATEEELVHLEEEAEHVRFIASEISKRAHAIRMEMTTASRKR